MLILIVMYWYTDTDIDTDTHTDTDADTDTGTYTDTDTDADTDKLILIPILLPRLPSNCFLQIVSCMCTINADFATGILQFTINSYDKL